MGGGQSWQNEGLSGSTPHPVPGGRGGSGRASRWPRQRWGRSGHLRAAWFGQEMPDPTPFPGWLSGTSQGGGVRPPGAACLGVSPRPWAPETSGAAVKVASAHMQVGVRGGEPSDFWAITVPGTSRKFWGTKSPISHFGGPRGCRHRVGDPCGLQLGLGEVWEQIPALVFSRSQGTSSVVAVPGHGEGPPERRAAPPACAPTSANTAAHVPEDPSALCLDRGHLQPVFWA